MLHYQGLSTKGPAATRLGPTPPCVSCVARLVRPAGLLRRLLGPRSTRALTFYRGDARRLGLARGAVRHRPVIRGYRVAAPASAPARRSYAYLHGSTDVGGSSEPSDPAAVAQGARAAGGAGGRANDRRLLAVYDRDRWARRILAKAHAKAEARDHSVRADRGQGGVPQRLGARRRVPPLRDHRLGGPRDMDLGSIVQYCAGGRLWIVDFGYNNVGPEHHSTLEVKRDGKPAWHKYEGRRGAVGRFLRWPADVRDREADRPARRGRGPFRGSGGARTTWPARRGRVR